MKKLFTIFILFLAMSYIAKADTINVLPTTVVIAIEALGGNGTVTVTGAGVIGTPVVDSIFTYAVCTIDWSDEVILQAIANKDYVFNGWSGNDAQYPNNLIPSDTNNPYDISLFSNGFIQITPTSWLDTIKIKAGFRDPTVCNTFYTINKDGYYETMVDDLGSKLSIDTTSSTLKVNYDQVVLAPASENWPYTYVIFYFNDQNYYLSNVVKAIQITYKSDHLWRMALPFTPILDIGGESHGIELPASTTFTTLTAYIDQFEVPVWALHRNIPLLIDSVKQIDFLLDEDATVDAYKGNFQIESIKLCGIGTEAVGIAQVENKTKDFTIYPNPANESLVVSTESLVNTEIQITNSLGQIVITKDYKLTNDTQTINIQDLSNGIYFIRIGNALQKFVVNK